MVKLNKLSFMRLPDSPYSTDIAPRDYWRFTDSNMMLHEERVRCLQRLSIKKHQGSYQKLVNIFLSEARTNSKSFN